MKEMDILFMLLTINEIERGEAGVFSTHIGFLNVSNSRMND
jgi:hypothetical protein